MTGPFSANLAVMQTGVTCVVAILVGAAVPLAPVAAQPGPGGPIQPLPSTDDVPSQDDPRDRPLLQPAHKPREIVIDVPGERSSTNKLVLGATLGMGVIAGAFGVYFNLQSRDAAAEVEAVKFIGEAWTQEEIALVERADRAGTSATIAYTIGGAFIIGTIAGFIATAPKSERTVIRTGASASLVPGGAIATTTWSF